MKFGRTAAIMREVATFAATHDHATVLVTSPTHRLTDFHRRAFEDAAYALGMGRAFTSSHIRQDVKLVNGSRILFRTVAHAMDGDRLRWLRFSAWADHAYRPLDESLRTQADREYVQQHRILPALAPDAPTWEFDR